MAEPGANRIDYAEPLMAADRRTAVLALLQERGRLIYWGPRGNCYIVERDGEKEALTGADVDREAFNYMLDLDDDAPNLPTTD